MYSGDKQFSDSPAAQPREVAVSEHKYLLCELGGCSGIFAESLLLLVERMRNLKRFYVGSLEVDDQLLQMIGEYMHGLQALNLEYCRKITDAGVLNMVYRTRSLVRIDVQNTEVSEKTKKVIFD
jgi:hypothetical protein